MTFEIWNTRHQDQDDRREGLGLPLTNTPRWCLFLQSSTHGGVRFTLAILHNVDTIDKVQRFNHPCDRSTHASQSVKPSPVATKFYWVCHAVQQQQYRTGWIVRGRVPWLYSLRSVGLVQSCNCRCISCVLGAVLLEDRVCVNWRCSIYRFINRTNF